MMGRRAFTLIELLIVVAIIAILAAIAVPNFLEAQMRAKVSRTQTDMRTITVAVESYKVDTNRYPWVVGSPLPQYTLPSGMENGTRIGGMTTPIAYLATLPTDPFGRVLGNEVYLQFGDIANNYFWATKLYYETRQNPFPWNVSPTDNGTLAEWVLLSKGPDKYFAPPDDPNATEHIDRPYRWAYDATNGTVSGGNIVRSGP